MFTYIFSDITHCHRWIQGVRERERGRERDKSRVEDDVGMEELDRWNNNCLVSLIYACACA